MSKGHATIKSLIGDIFIIAIFPFLTYSFGKYLIKKKVARIKLIIFILAVFFLFSLPVTLLWFHLQDFLKVLKTN